MNNRKKKCELSLNILRFILQESNVYMYQGKVYGLQRAYVAPSARKRKEQNIKIAANQSHA